MNNKQSVIIYSLLMFMGTATGANASVAPITFAMELKKPQMVIDVEDNQNAIPKNKNNAELFAVDINAKFPEYQDLHKAYTKEKYYDYGYEFTWNIGQKFRPDFKAKIAAFGMSDKRLKRQGEDYFYAMIKMLPKEVYPYIGPYLHQVPNMSERILQMPGIKETKNKFPERIAPQLQNIPNIEFLSPYLYFLLMPEVWPGYKFPTEYPKPKVNLPQTKYDASFMERIKKLVPPENYFPSQNPYAPKLADKLRTIEPTQTSPLSSADVKAFISTLSDLKDFASDLETQTKLVEARVLINAYEQSQGTSLPLNNLKDMVNPCQRLAQRLKLLKMDAEFVKIVGKQGFSLEEWAYTCDKTIKAYRKSKITATTLQSIINIQNNAYKEEISKLPDIFKGTQVITMLAVPEMYRAPYGDVMAVKKNRRELAKIFKELDYKIVGAPITIMP